MVYRPYYLAKELVKKGHNVSIIASSYSHLRLCTGKYKETELVDGIQYYWEKNISYRGNGLKRLFNVVIFSVLLFLKSGYYANKIKPDLVIGSSPHPFFIYGAKRIAGISKAKLFFEVRDLWPLTLIEIGGFSKWHPFVILMQHAEDYAYKYSDKVISVLPKAVGYMESRGMGRDKFIYLPNGIDPDDWENKDVPIELDTLIKEHKNSNKFLLAYTGEHGNANNLKYLIEAMHFIKNENVVLFLIGKGVEKQNLIELAKNMQLNNVVFLEPINKKFIPHTLSKFDALFISLKKEPLFKYGISPNKLMDYMMAGKPVIHAISAGNDLVAESGCGLSIQPESSLEIANAILKLKSLSENERLIMGEKGHQFILRNHLYPNLVNKLLSYL